VTDGKETVVKTEKKGIGRYILAAAACFFSAVIGIFFGGLVMLLLISAVTGTSPGSLLKGALGSNANRQINILTEEQRADVVVAVGKKVQPSIVNVRTTEVISDLFHQNQETKGEGSGVIYKEDGYIITNNHVVENAKDIFVTIGDEDLKGTVVGGDKVTDIAVIKIDKKGLQAAELGDSGKLQVGELAVAIGSPFGFEHSVTTGVISALHRNISTNDGQGQTYTNLIQTDAAINPGNSGGALANKEGKVVGINSLIFSPSGASAGLGFSIPIETAKNVADQLIEKGSVSHPYMGVLGQTVDKDIAKQLNLDVQEGAILQEVVAGGPADQAGLKRKDIIVKFDGQQITTMDDLVAAILAKQVGDKVTVEYIRDKETKTATVTLSEKPK
jgi:S1-C subfamily serine protease